MKSLDLSSDRLSTCVSTITRRISRMALLLLLLAIGASPAAASDYLMWNDVLGRSFEARIVDLGTRHVRLENREGTQIDFPIADLLPSSRAQLSSWQSEEGGQTASVAAAVHEKSAFDEMLLGNLVRLDGRRLKSCDDATRPKKFYVFYYTASWCPPCQQFTPRLVEWYEANKNDQFELVLISSDRDEDAMEDYAKDKSMPWPQLAFDEVEDFKDAFEHGVRGIPSVIVCELDGTVLGNYRSKLDALSELVN
jgi:nucleoredoxin